ncbi:MAG: hypothetical protein HZC41_08125 [Chloroflexi bacterium]|nr:hypothetical protein [Chloroflexota bacterium]
MPDTNFDDRLRCTTMLTSKFRGITGFSLLTAGILVTILVSQSGWRIVRGVVLDDKTPVSGAIVRIQGSATFTMTNGRGEFEIAAPPAGTPLTAWSPGYYVSATSAENQVIQLRRHTTRDNPSYDFISATETNSDRACRQCHAGQPAMPVDEWQQDAHAQAAVNPRFLSLYNGTTLDGRTGKPTQYRFDMDAGLNVPVAPSLGQAGVGAGFRLDLPDQAGPCAACHVPILALESPYNANPNAATGVAREGITCDFCHKLWNVRVNADGLPSPHLPGVLSVQMLRPPEGEQVFLGPFDDTPGSDIFSPLQNESRFCAACHTGTFWGVTMYNSFGEWLDSPYSDPTTGQTCQDCHMPHTGVTGFVNLPPDVTQFVPQRDPQTIFSHRMPGASDVDLLQNTATLELNAHADGNELLVTARVTNTNAGHHIPTDNPLRNMLLLIDARDIQGQRLSLREGPILPDWAGMGDEASGHYAGLPGVLYAKILADFYTGEMPTAAYWRQTRLASDNRIPALATDESVYRFALPGAAAVTVEARLIFRRAFIELMEQKAWDTPDILMEQARVTIEP